jgi:HTH-type transcriptional regulator/antitoxin HigA
MKWRIVMTDEKKTPHPGEILAAFLKKKGWTQVEFAEIIERSPVRVNEIIRGKIGISAKSAIEFAAALGTTPQFWMSAQTAYDLSICKKDVSNIKERAKERDAR